MAKKECIAMVRIIRNPPSIVSVLGCSFITIQTHKGPRIVSSRKNKFTSAAVINLGAIVTRTKGIATQTTHIKGTIIISLPSKLKSLTRKTANIATISFPITAPGTRFLFFCRPNYYSTYG